jgi:hypothetical protein
MRRKAYSNLKNITLSADAELIALARERARRSKSTLNDEFRNWLKQFTRSKNDSARYVQVIEKLGNVAVGRKFARAEFYEE